MTKVSIVTDSSAYLPQEFIDRYGIHVVPLNVIWYGKTYRDGVDITADEFYDRLASASELPTTSQTNVFTYEQLFKELIDSGNSVLVLPISAGLSACLKSALDAKENFPGAPIEIMDTRLVAMALSFQVLVAARAAEAGANLMECKAAAEAAYEKIGVYFTVETLKYLYKGGRIGGAKHLFGTVLKIRPVLEIKDGKIELVESVVTTRKAVQRMIDLVERDINIKGYKQVHISVFHAGAQKPAEELLEEVNQRFNPVESIFSKVSPVIGTHTGPGTLSIAYMVE
ncbi:MAG: DegV family protein [Chloroflexi bacterium]|nr:DegV family protein [Chloroflexota bacterium]